MVPAVRVRVHDGIRDLMPPRWDWARLRFRSTSSEGGGRYSNSGSRIVYANEV